MFNRHKDRLYLVLERKSGLPGYLWSIMLAPADEKAPNATDELSTRKWEIVERSPRAWMFQVQTIDLNRSPNVVARVILAKFNADDAMRSQIDEILGDLHIDEHNPDFRSRVWAMNGIEALHSAGISRHDMSRSDVEKLAFELANDAMLKLTRRELTLGKASDIPTKDIRW